MVCVLYNRKKKKKSDLWFWCFSNPAIRPPPAIFCSTRIPFPIPAKGLPATQCNNWKQTMKLYLHRNEVTCRRLQCRTPISFVFNQNEKFCWGRLFSECSWLAYEYVCVRVCVFVCEWLHVSPPPLVLLSILSPCQCIKMTPFQIRWQIATWQIMQMAHWWQTYLLGAQLFFDGTTVFALSVGADAWGCVLTCVDSTQVIYFSPLFTVSCVYFKIVLISLVTPKKKKIFILALFFLLVYHVVSWLLTET